MTSIFSQLADMERRMASMTALRNALGASLTPEQQVSLSERLVADPDAFSRWLYTDKGRDAVRELADKFMAK